MTSVAPSTITSAELKDVVDKVLKDPSGIKHFETYIAEAGDAILPFLGLLIREISLTVKNVGFRCQLLSVLVQQYQENTGLINEMDNYLSLLNEDPVDEVLEFFAVLIESHLPEVTEEHEKIVQHYFSDEKTDFARISVIRFLNSCLEWKPSFYKFAAKALRLSPESSDPSMEAELLHCKTMLLLYSN